jgi:hypothetical protein
MQADPTPALAYPRVADEREPPQMPSTARGAKLLVEHEEPPTRRRFPGVAGRASDIDPLPWNSSDDALWQRGLLVDPRDDVLRRAEHRPIECDDVL